MIASSACLAALLLAGCEDDSTAGPAPSAPQGEAGALTPDELLRRGGCAPTAGPGVEHGGFIEADETWSASAGPHRITSNVRITATVTIEPCAVVELGAGLSIEVGGTSAAGKLVARGEGDGANVRPVTFAAADAAQPWGQIVVQPQASLELGRAALVNGGAPGSGEAGALLVRGVAGGTNDGTITRSALLDHVLVEKSSSYGINLEAWGTLTETSKQVWIRGSGSDEHPSAVRLEPGIAGTLPRSLVATGNRADEILLRTSKTFMRDDTLLALGLPYRAHGPIYVGASTDGAPVTLTIEAGVTLGFEDAAGSGLVVGNSEKRQGILSAVGTEAAPIVFTSAAQAKSPGDWSNLYFRYTPATGNRISFARVEFAGGESGAASHGCGPNDNDAAILILGQGSEGAGPSEAFVDHTTFDAIAGETVIVSGWVAESGPDFSPTNTFGASTPSCKVSRPRRPGAGDVCDGGRDVCRP